MKIECMRTGMRVMLRADITFSPPVSRKGEIVGLRLSRRGNERVMFLPDSGGPPLPLRPCDIDGRTS